MWPLFFLGALNQFFSPLVLGPLLSTGIHAMSGPQLHVKQWNEQVTQDSQSFHSFFPDDVMMLIGPDTESNSVRH